MYCVIYKFNVKKEKAQEFIMAWKNVSKAYKTLCGSLGSRLHKTQNENVFIAYAQWPSKDVYDSNINKDEIVNGVVTTMRARCNSHEVVEQMEVISDLLV